jgi:hypothetical protein
MRDNEVITFNFEGRGEIKFTVAKCRELCPTETEALENATDEMAVASESGAQALALASKKVEQCLITLKNSLITLSNRRLEGK